MEMCELFLFLLLLNRFILLPMNYTSIYSDQLLATRSRSSGQVINNVLDVLKKKKKRSCGSVSCCCCWCWLIWSRVGQHIPDLLCMNKRNNQNVNIHDEREPSINHLLRFSRSISKPLDENGIFVFSIMPRFPSNQSNFWIEPKPILFFRNGLIHHCIRRLHHTRPFILLWYVDFRSSETWEKKQKK